MESVGNGSRNQERFMQNPYLQLCTCAGLNPLTAVDVYIRQGEWRRPTADVYIRIWLMPVFFVCSCFFVTPRTVAFCSPLESIPCMSGYKYSAKPRLRSPNARADASKLESEVAVNFAMLVALDSPIDEASKIYASRRRQWRLVASWGLWKSCMGEWKAKGRLGVTVTEARTLRKFDDVWSSIGEWRSTIGGCGERRQPGRQIWRHTDL